MDAITLHINGVKEEYSATISLKDLLASKQLLTAQGMAVAVNEQVIPKLEWDSTILKNNDNILIIKAVQGG